MPAFLVARTKVKSSVHSDFGFQLVQSRSASGVKVAVSDQHANVQAESRTVVPENLVKMKMGTRAELQVV